MRKLCSSTFEGCNISWSYVKKEMCKLTGATMMMTRFVIDVA